MTADWILVVGTLIFFVTGVVTINFGYAQFRALGARDSAETAEADEIRTTTDAGPTEAAPVGAGSAPEASKSS